MSSVRRLSKGSNVSLMEFESDDEVDAAVTTKGLNGMAMRRSSLGGSKNKLNPTEQSRIAEMYKTVIKLAAENKITAKNSWNLELIDHMGSLIKEDGSDRDNRGTVNFQKASCTLDASVKIYSHRVDDTWSSSFRILENLSRSNNPGEEEGEDGDGVKNPARVGSKSVSNRLNLTSTIEKNVASLNNEVVDCNHSADPMFHKMSQAFDEGGAKGMLMANLRVVPNTSSLVFTSEGGIELPLDRNTGAMIDVSDLIKYSGFSPLSLVDIPISSALQTYRDMISVDPSSKGLLSADTLTAVRDLSGMSLAAPTIKPIESFGNDCGSFNCDGDDNDVCDMFGSDEEDGGFGAVNVRRSSIIASPHRSETKLTAGTPAKGYDPIFDSLGGDEYTEQQTDTQIAQTQTATVTIPSAAAAGNEYSYFDATTLQTMGCNWAGARHWKLALRTAIKKTADVAPLMQKGTSEVTVEEVLAVVETKRPASKSAPKGPMRIDFTQGAVDVSSFLPPKGKRGGDPTSQTAGSVDKAMANARGGALLLPHDAQFTAKDLCRLFLRPRLIVPPHDLKEQLQPALMRYNADSLQKVDNLQSTAVSNTLYGEKDFIWGSFAADVLSFNVSNNEPALNMNQNLNDDDYDGENGGLYEGFGEDDDNTASESVDDVVSQMQGLSISNKNLIRATRVVEKVNIGYATVAKRVNVKKLKHDLWSHLEDSMVPGSCAEENTAPGQKIKLEKSQSQPNVLSFQDVISDISNEQKQKDVSLSFYFICLLHLANEKNLDIKAVDTMSDLQISKPV